MFSGDRMEFEEHLAILFAGFPTLLTPPRVEAYWRGLDRMSLDVFKRCVDQMLGEHGEKTLPTPNRVWKVSRELRVKPPAPNPQASLQLRNYDDFHRFGQRRLFEFLIDNGAASNPSLAKLIERKNKLVGSFRVAYAGNSESAEDDDIAEYREIFRSEFRKLFEPRTYEETERDRQQFCRERSMPFTPMSREEWAKRTGRVERKQKPAAPAERAAL